MDASVVKAVFSLGLTLLVLSLLALIFAPRDSPGLVPAALAVAANLVTVIGAAIILRRWAAAQRRDRRR